MRTKQHLAVWAGSALLATGALVGCGPGDQQEPGTPPATEQTAPEDTATDDNMAMYEPEDAGEDTATAEDPAMTDDRSTADRSYASPEGGQAGGSLEGMSDDEIVGKAIVSRDGEEIGDVDEVVVDGTTGQKFVVVDVGGFLGVGEKSIVVALDELQAADDDRIQSDLTRETLQTQTEYDPTYFKKSEEEESSTY
jgi:sporulation protein YlmC with PRC-barrel domain